MTDSGITLDELFNELRKFDTTGDGGMTTNEISENLNIPANAVRVLLSKAIDTGRVVNFQEKRINKLRNNRPYWANCFKVVKT